MKKFILVALISFLSLPIFAQAKFGEDSVKCVKNLSLYRDYYKQNMFDEAYRFWRVAYKVCPQSSERMYIDGFKLVEYIIKSAKTEEEKAAYVDTLLSVYDQRIQYFGKEGYVLGRKGAEMLRYTRNDIEAIYSTLERAVQLEGMESDAGAIVSYMNATVLMERESKLEKDSVVNVFLALSEIVEYNIKKNEGGNLQDYFIRAQEAIERIASAYLDCDILVKMAEDNYDNKKSDTEWLERTSSLLDKKGCNDETIFFKIAKTMHDSKPSSTSAYNMGVMFLKRGENKSAAEYFNQAIRMSEGSSDTYSYYIALAQTYSNMGAYGQGKAAAQKASEIEPNKGLPYMMIGNMIAASESMCKTDDPCISKAIYWLAEDYFIKAKSVDGSVTESANKRISSNKKYFPSINDCFFKAIKEGDTVEIKCWINESTKARF